jgi:hypothetical protein
MLPESRGQTDVEFTSGFRIDRANIMGLNDLWSRPKLTLKRLLS